MLYTAILLLCLFWTYINIYLYISTGNLPKLRDKSGSIPCADRELPLLSIIIPACNEAEHLEAALTSRLAQDYPNLELVVINDRSTDDTAGIIEHLAASDTRIKAVHIESLPAGWLGKVHALHRGVEHATGEWYLFTDADVYFQSGTVRNAVCYAQHHRLLHLACLPELKTSDDFWLDVTIRAFFMLFCISARFAGINRENSRWAVGIGAFNLVAAEAFNNTRGFEWLRMEPADDMGVGLMMKQSGARSHLINAEGEITVPWYESMHAMFKGLEKNSFGPGANYSYARQCIIVLLLWCLAAVPLTSLLAGLYLYHPLLIAAGSIAFAATLFIALVMPRNTVRDIVSYMFMPAGIFIISLIMLNSAWKCWKNNGIDWRGTHYSVDELKQGQRVRF